MSSRLERAPLPTGPREKPLQSTGSLATRKEIAENPNKIDKICTILQVGKGYVYVGFTLDERPMATDNLSDLNPEALSDIEANRQSYGFNPRPFRARKIIPLLYSHTIRGRDFEDRDGEKAADLVEYGLIDSTGQTRHLMFDELSLLKALVEASRNYWQDSTSATYGVEIYETKRIYTFLIPSWEDSETVYAILFKPTVEKTSNEPATKNMVVRTLDILLQMDKHQKERRPGTEKGYTQAAGNPKQKTEINNWKQLIWLFAKLNDEQIAQFSQWLRDRAADFLDFLRIFQFYHFTPEEIDSLRSPELTFELSNLSLDSILNIAELMLPVAEKTLGRRYR